MKSTTQQPQPGHRPIRAYYVEIRNLHGHVASGFEAKGFLSTEGVFTALPGMLPTSNKSYRASDLPDDVVVVTGRDQRGEMRSIAQRKEIAAVAEAHGFTVRRGAPKSG